MRNVPEQFDKMIQTALEEYASVGKMELDEKEAGEYAGYMIKAILAG